MSKLIYRKRGVKSVKVTASISKEAQAKLEAIQKAFAVRWPVDTYPTISAVLEAVLERHATELEADPDWLDAEVQEFQRRYLSRPN
jgi:hypothetical protein